MDESARKRAQIIMKVNCGLMTATQAAKELNVSRKTYYKWEKKGLAALLGNVTDQKAGRPKAEQDPKQKDLEQKLAQALKETEVLRRKMELKDILADVKPGIDRDKKNKAIIQIVQEILALKAQFSLSMVSLTIWIGISYSSFMRWKRRVLANEPPIKKPGPKKTAALDLVALKKDISSLRHCLKKSHGAGALIKKYQLSISRQYLARLIYQARQHANNKTAYRITWHHPDIAWAIDGCEVKSSQRYTRIYVQNLQDMGSIYKFLPLTTFDEPCGEAVSTYLKKRFERYGLPLFLKRDNAKNYNCRIVDELLEERMVIPLNSPCYYAPYNGSIEHAQGELKTCLENRKAETVTDMSTQVEMAIHDLNHKPRRVLKGQNACQAYFKRNRPVYGKRKRRQIFDWIKELAIEISVKAGKDKISSSAWRFACRKWMEENGVITVKRSRKVLPDFSLSFCQN